MKARLIHIDNEYQLLLCTRKIQMLSPAEARKFLLEYDHEEYYSGPGSWDYEGLAMEDYAGETVARVDDDGILSVVNGPLFRGLIENFETKYLSVAEYAAKHGKQPPIVRRMCMNGRIKGVKQSGRSWLIPENSPYPADARVGKRV